MASATPDKVAYRMAGSGAAISYGELDRATNQGAQLFRSLGLRPQDHIALLAENSLRFLEICWAAQRCGLYFTAISTHLTAGEIAYIVADCGAKVWICTDHLSAIAGEIAEMIPVGVIRYMSGTAAGWLAIMGCGNRREWRPSRLPTRSPAMRCSIRPARPASQKASSGRSSASRSGS